MGIFACFLFKIRILYRLQANDIDYKLWDMSTITANDFSIEFKISKELWDEQKQFRLKSLR